MVQLNRIVKVISLSSAIFFSSTSLATLIPVGLDIDGALTATTVDPFGSSSALGSSTVGGGLSAGTDLTIGAEIAALTDIGDGFHLDAAISGHDSDGVTYDGFGNELIFDLAMLLDNTTASDYKITFDLRFLLSADADGEDAFVQSLLSFDDTITTFFGEDHTSDTLFGDLVNGVDPGTLGDPQGIIGSTSFFIDVVGGTSASLHGAGALRGAAFLGSFSGLLDFDLTIASIEDITPTAPNPVPEPAAIGLFALGLLLMRKKISQ